MESQKIKKKAIEIFKIGVEPVWDVWENHWIIPPECFILAETDVKSRGYKVQDHKADNLVTVSRGDVTNYFYIFGGKDERSQDLIQGITLAGVFLMKWL